jgi:flagellar motor protein MotB
LKKYRRIFEAEKENPELAKVLKEDLELKEKRNKLLRRIRASTNDAEKKRLTKELEEVVSSRFDLIVKRKQIEYEQLSKKLEKLKEQVKRSEAEVEKWENVKDKEVKQRLEELISRAEKFNWE